MYFTEGDGVIDAPRLLAVSRSEQVCYERPSALLMYVTVGDGVIARPEIAYGVQLRSDVL
jgi:hypothetical protein